MATYNIAITPEVRGWTTEWQDIPLNVVVMVTKVSDNSPASDVTVTLELAGLSGVSGIWNGEGVDGNEFTTQPDGRAHATVRVIANSVIAGTAQIRADIGDDSKSQALLLQAPKLTAPYYPLAADGVIDESDVKAGVYARMAVQGSETGDVLGLYFGSHLLTHSISEDNQRVSLQIPEPLLAAGPYSSAYYAIDWVGNVSFSDVTSFIVERDNPTGAIKDLPEASVPLASNGFINMYDAEQGVAVLLDGEYEGRPVYLSAKSGTTWSLYWNSYLYNGTAVPAASRIFRGEIEDEVVPTIDDFFNDELSAIKDLLYALGEGYVTLTYEMTLKDDQLHSSKAHTFTVDVIPPGGRNKKTDD